MFLRIILMMGLMVGMAHATARVSSYAAMLALTNVADGAHCQIIGSSPVSEFAYSGPASQWSLFSVTNMTPTNTPTAMTPTITPTPQIIYQAIACYGDSLTGGNYSNQGGYPAWLAKYLNASCINYGISGETSAQILVRMGYPLACTITGSVIPTSGPVSLVLPSGYSPLDNSDVYTIQVYLDGVQGQYTFDGTYEVFTRHVSGTPVTDSGPATFKVNTGQSLNYPIIIMAGYNDRDDPVSVETNLSLMETLLKNNNNSRYIFMTIPNGEGQGVGTSEYTNIVTSIDGYILSTFPNNSFDMRSYWVSIYNPNISGDVTDHTNDIPPGSMRGDYLHPNDIGYSNIANKLASVIYARGWSSSFPSARELLTAGLGQGTGADTNVNLGGNSGQQEVPLSALYNLNLGTYSGFKLTIGQRNTFAGYESGAAISGLQNYDTALGCLSLYGDTSGGNNTAVGNSSSQSTGNATGLSSFGASCNLQNAGNYASVFGYNAASGTTNGVGISGFGAAVYQNTVTLQYGTALGFEAGNNCTGSDYSIYIGDLAGLNDTLDPYRVIISSNAQTWLYGSSLTHGVTSIGNLSSTTFAVGATPTPGFSGNVTLLAVPTVVEHFNSGIMTGIN